MQTLRRAKQGAVVALALATVATASSHREAPYITRLPKVDATDLYVFRSYETGRDEFVTILANYYPLQVPEGGPSYFMLDPEALYEIHIDNNGDATEDVTFQFRFDNQLQGEGNNGLALPIGPAGDQKTIAVPLLNIGPITTGDTANLNVKETYELKVVRGDRRTGTASDVARVGGGEFVKPVDYIGEKSLPDYDAYARSHIYEVEIPGCTPPSGENARVFVGQRRDPFYVNLGQIFDLVNVPNPVGDMDQTADSTTPHDAENVTARYNVTTLALEIPASCLNADDDTIFGVWTTASMRQARVQNPMPTYNRPTREGGAWTQVSRLGMPLVNEVVIGLKDKNLFNAAHPTIDSALIDYVTHPALPELLEILFGAAGVVAPNAFPRNDLVAVFLTGVEGVNKTTTPAEMIRINTAPELGLKARGEQNNLGAALCFDAGGVLDTTNAGCDPTGFPNGRRPGDDVVDISLRVAMGYLLPESDAPSGGLTFTDGVTLSDQDFNGVFPYLQTPQRGSP